MIKALFLDVDGTLLSHTDGKVPESSRAALRRAREKGIKLFLATGRHMLELEGLPLEGIRADGYVTLNGQMCLNAEKEVIYDVPVPEQDVRTMTALFEKRALPVMIVEKDRMYVNYIDDALRQAQRDISTPLQALGTYHGAPVYQFSIYGGEELLKKVEAQLKDCRLTRWNRVAADVLPRKGDKLVGIRALLDLHGLTREEIMTFGDADNDIDMIRFAAIGVAMGNAIPELKAQADYVTTHIDEDGILHALEHFGIL